jgi:hypothetical protein
MFSHALINLYGGCILAAESVLKEISRPPALDFTYTKIAPNGNGVPVAEAFLQDWPCFGVTTLVEDAKHDCLVGLHFCVAEEVARALCCECGSRRLTASKMRPWLSS